MISNSQLSDSGNYTCQPNNALPDTVNIHVLQVDNHSKPDNILNKLGLSYATPDSQLALVIVLGEIIFLSMKVLYRSDFIWVA